jgi:Holliday junction resolvasome RuvABC DNA-binding subunit
LLEGAVKSSERRAVLFRDYNFQFQCRPRLKCLLPNAAQIKRYRLSANLINKSNNNHLYGISPESKKSCVAILISIAQTGRKITFRITQQDVTDAQINC